MVIALFPWNIPIWIGQGALTGPWGREEPEKVNPRCNLTLQMISLTHPFFLSGSNCGYGAFGRYCLVSRIVIAKGEGSYVFNTLLLCCDLPVRKVSGCKTRISRNAPLNAGSRALSGCNGKHLYVGLFPLTLYDISLPLPNYVLLILASDNLIDFSKSFVLLLIVWEAV